MLEILGDVSWTTVILSYLGGLVSMAAFFLVKWGGLLTDVQSHGKRLDTSNGHIKEHAKTDTELTASIRAIEERCLGRRGQFDNSLSKNEREHHV